jgi:hypothetical protein
MQIRHSRQTQARESVPGESHARRSPRERRRAWTTLSAALLALALMAAALMAPSTQARRPKAELPKEVEGKWADGMAMVTCRQVHWTFANLPNTPDGTVTVVEQLRVAGSKRRTTFSFEGTAGSHTTVIDAPQGPDGISAVARWKVGKLSGHLSIHAKLTCGPASALSVEKEQEIAGGGGPFTTAPLTGLSGQTVDYEILVQNTGNVPLTLGNFSDPHCDAETLSGGPGAAALAPEAQTAYTCAHTLDEADQSAGSYANTAAVTGTPPAGEGAPVTGTSNTVVVRVPWPAFSVEKLQQIAGDGSYTTVPVIGLIGQTVDYEILVANTGDVPLTLGSFSDPHCDAGTLSGGPGGAALAPQAATTYTCAHMLDQADLSAGSYSSMAAVTGTPPLGEGWPVTHTSNAVVVKVAPDGAAGQRHHGGTTGTGTSSTVNSSGGSPAPVADSGVLGFTAAGVPPLDAPQSCVRSGFRVSIKSAGVASVTFYLDGHRLKTLTWRNARKGLLTIEIDSSKLKAGAHRLAARITMARGSSKKATVASRTVRIVRCRAAAVTLKFTH